MVKGNQDSQSNLKKATEIFLEKEVFIRKAINSHVNDKTLADDIYQDFFISIVERPMPETVTNINSYINRALRNDVIDAARRKDARRRMVSNYCEKNSDKIDKVTLPDERLLTEEFNSKISSIAQKNLPKCQYRAITLRYQQGYNVDETAEKMKINKRSVSRYVSVGLKKLGEKIKEKHPEFYECA